MWIYINIRGYLDAGQMGEENCLRNKIWIVDIFLHAHFLYPFSASKWTFNPLYHGRFLAKIHVFSFHAFLSIIKSIFFNIFSHLLLCDTHLLIVWNFFFPYLLICLPIFILLHRQKKQRLSNMITKGLAYANLSIEILLLFVELKLM